MTNQNNYTKFCTIIEESSIGESQNNAAGGIQEEQQAANSHSRLKSFLKH
jgi:hypothetical protein